MSYTFPEPEYYPTDEENKLEVLKYPGKGCWLADVVHKESSDTMTVHEHDHPAFFAEKSSYFDYPDAKVLNEMIKDGLLSVHISAWRTVPGRIRTTTCVTFV
jgi:hypothetical protein